MDREGEPEDPRSAAMAGSGATIVVADDFETRLAAARARRAATLAAAGRAGGEAPTGAVARPPRGFEKQIETARRRRVDALASSEVSPARDASGGLVVLHGLRGVAPPVPATPPIAPAVVVPSRVPGRLVGAGIAAVLLLAAGTVAWMSPDAQVAVARGASDLSRLVLPDRAPATPPRAMSATIQPVPPAAGTAPPPVPAERVVGAASAAAPSLPLPGIAEARPPVPSGASVPAGRPVAPALPEGPATSTAAIVAADADPAPVVRLAAFPAARGAGRNLPATPPAARLGIATAPGAPARPPVDVASVAVPAPAALPTRAAWPSALAVVAPASGPARGAAPLPAIMTPIPVRPGSPARPVASSDVVSSDAPADAPVRSMSGAAMPVPAAAGIAPRGDRPLAGLVSAAWSPPPIGSSPTSSDAAPPRAAGDAAPVRAWPALSPVASAADARPVPDAAPVPTMRVASVRPVPVRQGGAGLALPDAPARFARPSAPDALPSPAAPPGPTCGLAHCAGGVAPAVVVTGPDDGDRAGAILARLGFDRVTRRDVALPVRRGQVRYFREADAAAAQALAFETGADAIDLTWYVPRPETATIELRLPAIGPAVTRTP